MVSSPTIQRWVEPRSSCRTYAHLTDITTSTSFQRISGLLKSTNSASCEPTSTYAESCCADRISRFVHQSAYALSRYWDLKKRLLGNYAWEPHSTSTRAERFHIVLVLPPSCFTPGFVAYSLRGCSHPFDPLRQAVQKFTSVVGLLRTSSKWILESWHSQWLVHISLDRLLLQYCMALNSDLECQ